MGCRPTRVGSNGLLNEVNRDPQADPDNVDEVPVVRHDDGSGCLCRGELGLERPEQHNKERNHTGQHVCAVETGRDEEHRAVNGARDRGSSLDEVEVLVSLTDKEHGSQQRRQCVPTTKSEDIPPLSRENAELRSHGRGDQADRNRRRERHVQLAWLGWPIASRVGLAHEVHRGQASKTHQFLRQEHDRADADHVRSVQRRNTMWCCHTWVFNCACHVSKYGCFLADSRFPTRESSKRTGKQQVKPWTKLPVSPLWGMVGTFGNRYPTRHIVAGQRMGRSVFTANNRCVLFTGFSQQAILPSPVSPLPQLHTATSNTTPPPRRHGRRPRQ